MTEELNKQCAEFEQRLKTQDEQMVQREMTIQELNIKLKVSRRSGQSHAAFGSRSVGIRVNVSRNSGQGQASARSCITCSHSQPSRCNNAQFVDVLWCITRRSWRVSGLAVRSSTRRTCRARPPPIVAPSPCRRTCSGQGRRALCRRRETSTPVQPSSASSVSCKASARAVNCSTTGACDVM